jgi:hypothetical protein
MSFAICFYGHIRTWEQTKQSFIDNILNSIYPTIPDIFVHTYDDNNNLNSTKTYTENEIQELLQLKLSNNTIINPKKIVIDNFTSYQENIINEANNNNLVYWGYGDNFGVYKTLSEIKKIYLSYMLMKNYEKENSIKYDKIMITRFDYSFDQPLSLSDIKSSNTIYTWYTGSPDPCDEIVCGYSNAIHIFCSRYNEIFKVKDEVILEMGRCPTNDSHLLLKHCYIKYGIGNWGWTNFKSAKKIV